MPGRTIIITGASDGIGAAAARRLTAEGETVVVVGRSRAKTTRIADELGAASFVADFAQLDSVRELARDLLAAYPQIDVLANNAGGLMGAREVTTDGFEKTLQVNHLAPFLLTNLLLDTLIASRASVLNTSSIAAQRFGHLDLADLGNTRGYSPTKAYGDGKLANVLFTRELHHRFHGDGISTAAFHPGNVATGFASDTTSALRFVYHTPLKRLLLISPERGADDLVWLATATPGTDWVSGAYYAKKRLTRTNKQADDADLARRLWDRSAEMVGIRTPTA
jgi:NAD(P)-dependent dehydrogenase (short-subunit alcohol dehydrogenase family)